jgi:hypothetical protein
MLLAGSCWFGGAINPKDIESVIRSMNETRVEASARDSADKRSGELPIWPRLSDD